MAAGGLGCGDEEFLGTRRVSVDSCSEAARDGVLRPLVGWSLSADFFPRFLAIAIPAWGCILYARKANASGYPVHSLCWVMQRRHAGRAPSHYPDDQLLYRVTG